MRCHIEKAREKKTMGCAENDAVLKISQTQTESVRFNAVLAAAVNT